MPTSVERVKTGQGIWAPGWGQCTENLLLCMFMNSQVTADSLYRGRDPLMLWNPEKISIL